jgi:hypothetical protein
MRFPTSVLAAAGLICGYGLAVGSGSRPLGGVALLLFAIPCVAIWAHRHGRRRTVLLTTVGVGAFAVSHALGPLIGAWPAVLAMAAAVFVTYWRLSDSRSTAAEAPGVAA